MKRNEFLNSLQQQLADLPYDERQDILADFEEHFRVGANSGKSEEEIAEELGDPAELAKQYVDGRTPPKAEGGRSVAQGILAGTGLLLFDLMIGIPIISAIIAVWVSLWAAVIGILAAAAVLFVAPLFAGMYFGLIFASLSLLGLSGLMGIGMVYLTVYLFKGLKYYCVAHYRIIKGGIKR